MDVFAGVSARSKQAIVWGFGILMVLVCFGIGIGGFFIAVSFTNGIIFLCLGIVSGLIILCGMIYYFIFYPKKIKGWY